MLRKVFGCFILSIILYPTVILAYPWPVAPLFNTQHPITGVLGEYRTTPRPHFHEGVDIGRGAGTAVYPVVSGTIRQINNVENGSVRVRGDDGREYRYVHINPDDNLREGQRVIASRTRLGVIGSIRNPHLHFEEGDGAYNPLRSGGLTPYRDTSRTFVSTLTFYRQGTNQQIRPPLWGSIDILSRAWDAQSNGSNVVAIYRIGYQIQDENGNLILGPIYNIQFDRITNATLDLVYDTTQSNNSTYFYWVTNAMNENRYLNTNLRRNQPWNGSDARVNSEAAYPDGRYRISVLAFDIQGNGGNVQNQQGAITSEVIFDNFRPYVERVTIGDRYQGEWTFDGRNLNFRNPVNRPLSAGVYTITILFSEPVTTTTTLFPTLSIDGGIGSIPLTASPDRRTFSGRLNISQNSPRGTRTMTINAYDLVGNRILQITPRTTQINPITQLKRNAQGVMQGVGGNDTRHQFLISARQYNLAKIEGLTVDIGTSTITCEFSIKNIGTGEFSGRFTLDLGMSIGSIDNTVTLPVDATQSYIYTFAIPDDIIPNKYEATVKLYYYDSLIDVVCIPFEVYGANRVPEETRLLQVYPNPVRSECWIPFELAQAAAVKLKIFNVSGQCVYEMDLGQLSPGRYIYNAHGEHRDNKNLAGAGLAAYWNSRDVSGQLLPSGVYFYKLIVQSTNTTQTYLKRLVVIR